jgi:tRNA U34 5-methylaminomethyl-2-thiouridine-forming methyltransferase MnmC
MRNIIITSDGSASIELPEWKVTYHSRNGAISESLHVYIEAGFKYAAERNDQSGMKIFEMGFGTGLNALLTIIEAEKRDKKIHYRTIEKFPLPGEEAGKLNYTEILGQEELFRKLHTAEWEKDIPLTRNFTLRKEIKDLIQMNEPVAADLIYYDAFAPSAQPELWTEEIFRKLFSMLSNGGILVTYCSKGDVRRAMKGAGFRVEKLLGPKWKREIVRAHKD